VTKSYAALQKQIQALTKEADKLKAKEVAGVLARIREAVEHYDLTIEDIFSAGKAKTGRVKRAIKSATKKAAASEVKYRDEAGNTWGGRGPRPAWFKAALEAGKNADDFLVK
jgi:DNA-binding protein H-NS